MSKDIRAGGLSEALGTLIAKLCYRAADDIGEEFTARIGNWRRGNAIKILENAAEKHALLEKAKTCSAPPRLVHTIIEEGSWTEDDRIHSFWAGLLASSCTKDGTDEGNLVFVNILKQLTSLGAQILDYACDISEKSVTEGGWLASEPVTIERDELVELTGESDIQRLDRELDHLRSLELILEGFNPVNTLANITPSALALHMYVRCQGFVGSPAEYFGIEPPREPAP